jgi:uncharacterized OsmC-like protein
MKSDADRIRAMYDRKRRALTARPSLAWARGTSSARLGDGFACTVTSGPHDVAVDLPGSDGGSGVGPSPAQVMRSGLAACLAMGYRLWGIRLGVPLDEVTVEVTCELDARGQLGVDGVPAGWQRVSWAVLVATHASEDDVLRVLDEADRTSPMLANLDRDIVRRRTVTISQCPS